MRSGFVAESSARLAEVARGVRRIIGVPDYDEYLAHVRACHPDDEPVTRDAFAREALDHRYLRPGSRCC
ncbi:MAG: YbdD/YjiX family protein [Gemmatimonadota bacterium]|nr:YbdD/YjiX family protein [Gemmatimonadota bacterium]